MAGLMSFGAGNLDAHLLLRAQSELNEQQQQQQQQPLPPPPSVPHFHPAYTSPTAFGSDMSLITQSCDSLTSVPGTLSRTPSGVFVPPFTSLGLPNLGLTPNLHQLPPNATGSFGAFSDTRSDFSLPYLYGNNDLRLHTTLQRGGFPVKPRHRTTKRQFRVLERQFRRNPRPDAATRDALAAKLNMRVRTVQIWFQNRRAKSKRDRERGRTTPPLPPPDDSDQDDDDVWDQDMGSEGCDGRTLCESSNASPANRLPLPNCSSGDFTTQSSDHQTSSPGDNRRADNGLLTHWLAGVRLGGAQTSTPVHVAMQSVCQPAQDAQQPPLPPSLNGATASANHITQMPWLTAKITDEASSLPVATHNNNSMKAMNSHGLDAAATVTAGETNLVSSDWLSHAQLGGVLGQSSTISTTTLFSASGLPDDASSTEADPELEAYRRQLRIHREQVQHGLAALSSSSDTLVSDTPLTDAGDAIAPSIDPLVPSTDSQHGNICPRAQPSVMDYTMDASALKQDTVSTALPLPNFDVQLYLNAMSTDWSNIVKLNKDMPKVEQEASSNVKASLPTDHTTSMLFVNPTHTSSMPDASITNNVASLNQPTTSTTPPSHIPLPTNAANTEAKEMNHWQDSVTDLQLCESFLSGLTQELPN